MSYFLTGIYHVSHLSMLGSLFAVRKLFLCADLRPAIVITRYLSFIFVGIYPVLSIVTRIMPFG
jgi:hypothetical protein